MRLGVAAEPEPVLGREQLAGSAETRSRHPVGLIEDNHPKVPVIVFIVLCQYE